MKKKIWIRVILVLALVMLVGGVMIYNYLGRNLERLLSEPVGVMDLEKVEDGTFTGEFKAFPVEVIVDVEVMDHALSRISIIEHINGQGKDAESITDEILDKQSLQVDTVSGATYSSIAILKAVEDALKDQ